jgi:hypothetical protein
VARRLAGLAILLGLPSCRGPQPDAGPKIEFTRLPPAAKGGPDTLDRIEGRVTGARPGQKIVVFSHSGAWWVEPGLRLPLTPIESDSSWKLDTHLGTEYAALLVEPGYQPPARTDTLPAVGGLVVSLARAPGDPNAPVPHHTLQFSGYEWRARAAESNRGGLNQYDPANAWTDPQGALHLRIARAPSDWTSAEVSLTRRLGYGTYRFVVGNVSHLEAAAVFGIFTWDGVAVEANNREVAIEISRWGVSTTKENAQYLLQPYYAPGNVARFLAPAGVLTHWLRWEAGRATFWTTRGSGPADDAPAIARHVFTSGVPSAGDERLRMNLYVFRRGEETLRNGTEVVIERFEFLP